MIKNCIKILPDKTKYLFSGNIWVRDFNSKSNSNLIQDLYNFDEIKLITENEIENKSYNLPLLDKSVISAFHVSIISDGYDFPCDVPKNSLTIGVNGTLKENFIPNYYLFLHPGKESLSWFPNHLKTLPSLIASTKSNPEFIRKWKNKGGIVFFYVPNFGPNYSTNIFKPKFFVDDYRDPVCAGIYLSYKWGCTKLSILAPHDLYKEPRIGTESINNLYIYPQMMNKHKLIDGCLYWFKEFGGEAEILTSGPIFNNAKTLIPIKEILSK